MPRYLKSNGKRVPNFKSEKSWIVIPIKGDDTMKHTETYLVQPRVADYIVLLESKIKEDLPKLPIKN